MVSSRLEDLSIVTRKSCRTVASKGEPIPKRVLVDHPVDEGNVAQLAKVRSDERKQYPQEHTAQDDGSIMEQQDGGGCGRVSEVG